jgi:hypothetical protein
MVVVVMMVIRYLWLIATGTPLALVLKVCHTLDHPWVVLLLQREGVL